MSRGTDVTRTPPVRPVNSSVTCSPGGWGLLFGAGVVNLTLVRVEGDTVTGVNRVASLLGAEITVFPSWNALFPQIVSTAAGQVSQPSTLNPHPSTLNPQPSTLNPQP